MMKMWLYESTLYLKNFLLLMQIKIYLMSMLMFLILVMIVVMMSVAFFTLLERKIMGIFHYRKGPNKTSLMGMFQPFSDAIKLMLKEFFSPQNCNIYIYLLMPMFLLVLMILMWLIYPFMENLFMFKYSFLYFLSVLSIGVYGIMIGGWASNSSFSMIGAIRSIAQSISYEVNFSISLMIMIFMLTSYNLYELIYFNYKFIFFLYPNFIFFFFSVLAEINRTPFDLSEGKSELVSGFNIEYSKVNFTLIFLSEYASILLMSFLINYMFILNNLMSFLFYFNILLMIFFITWIRVTFPRVRYDKLMYLCWFYLLSLILMLMLYVNLYIKFLQFFTLFNLSIK
uniref:NADH-ubiquinone oxidoreductase chain 1 n=1 Tax=Sigalphus bicolor TaxID=515846 RepID=A0A0A6ZL62_9HYME|nr:NADH dehydrogenase subunit 1 [Sigalphus bicolor]